MISFSQFLILVLVFVLLFGDSRHIFHRVLLIFFNTKTLLQNIFFKKGDEKKKDKED